ncbi:MAG: ribonuclease P protein component [Nocardioidaceae bacterium]|nr:ribonuclease P protein component [Nocardioidaceae bacterium]
MLPAHHRLRTPEHFRAVSRRGRRAGSRTVVTHLLRSPTPPVVDVSPESGPGAPRVGFVVSKAVGNAVVRNQVKRRLRHAAAERLDRLVPGSLLVIRAQPSAATARYQELEADVDRCLERLLRAESAEQVSR